MDIRPGISFGAIAFRKAAAASFLTQAYGLAICAGPDVRMCYPLLLYDDLFIDITL
jgi:hypothetical protein